MSWDETRCKKTLENEEIKVRSLIGAGPGSPRDGRADLTNNPGSPRETDKETVRVENAPTGRKGPPETGQRTARRNNSMPGEGPQAKTPGRDHGGPPTHS